MKISAITIIFTAVILYIAATQLDWASLLNALQQTRGEFVALSLAVWICLVFFKAYKWQRIVSALNGNISLRESASILLIGLFVSIITPGRLGDFVRAIYVKDRLSLGKGIMAVIVDRAMDVITLLIFSGIGLILLTRASGIEIISPEIVAGLIIFSIVGLSILLNKKWVRKIFRLVQRFLPKTMQKLLVKHGQSFYESIPLFQSNIFQVGLALFASTCAWLLTITFGWLLMLALNLPLDWSAALAVIPILALIEIIPVGVIGIGTREIGAVIVLSAWGIPPELAIAYSLLFFAIGYIPSFVLGSWLFNKKPLFKNGGIGGIAKYFE